MISIQKKNSASNKLNGFTLIELLVILFLIGLSSSILILNTSKPHKKQKPSIIEFLEQEYKNSLLTAQIIDIQLIDKKLESSRNTSFPLTKEQAPSKESYLPKQILTTFYPDGTMSASTFNITTQSGTYVISTSPFSPKINYKQIYK